MKRGLAMAARGPNLAHMSVRSRRQALVYAATDLLEILLAQWNSQTDSALCCVVTHNVHSPARQHQIRWR